MSTAAFAKADQHNHERFLRDWKTVIEGAIALKPGRTQIRSGSLDVRRLTVSARPSSALVDRVRRSTKVRRLLGSTPVAPLLIGPALASAPAGDDGQLHVTFAARLHLEVGRNRKLISEAVVTLTAICEADGSFVEVPLTVRRSDTTFKLTARFGLDQVFDQLGPGAQDAHLRLRVDWRNSCWETFLGRGRPRRFGGLFAPDSELILSRRSRD